MQILLYSHEADLIYEAATSVVGFKVNLIEIA